MFSVTVSSNFDGKLVDLSVAIPKISSEHSKAIQAYDKDVLDPLRLKSFNFSFPSLKNQMLFSPLNLLTMSGQADISQPTPVSSHRKILGPFIVFVKKKSMKVAKVVIQIFFRRQISFNSELVALAHAFVAMESRVKDLETKLKQQIANEKNDAN